VFTYLAECTGCRTVRIMKITEAIVAEHVVFISMFDQIERVLPTVKSQAEVGTIAAMVAGLLGDHARAETDIAFVALDHVLLHKHEIETMHREHHEMDDRLLQARTAPTCKAAQRLLRAAMRASVRHFRNEERYILPALERTLKPRNLAALGKAFLEVRGSKAKPRAAHSASERPLASRKAWPYDRSDENQDPASAYGSLVVPPGGLRLLRAGLRQPQARSSSSSPSSS
jgi:hypothetical protein